MQHKRIILIVTGLLLSFSVRAQEKVTECPADSVPAMRSVEAMRPSQKALDAAGFRNPFKVEHRHYTDTYNEEETAADDRQYEDYDPTGYKVLGGTLHGSVTAGVNVGFGGNNPWRGATFFTGLSGTWLKPVSNRLALGVGLDFMHYAGSMGNFNTLGIYGMANYRFSDRVDLTGFVAHNFGILGGNSRTGYVPCGYYPLSPCSAYPYMGGYNLACPSTTIGADLGIKVGNHAAINIGLSFTKEEGMRPPFMTNEVRRTNKTTGNEDVVKYHER